ncbi:hypothetical protein TTHERM_00188420 (macronuclear) [Tetrahymena thermophila SB210]|uniref:Uncharacterized protein n=1 Tax=Tetrahymena thermophila (strain SB210) TaxID=312017 RepID=I7M7Y6_TETTS|nr:hypothetical protein TTHERM_00188420 [Tetrahymena thermophila SB210]EAR96273.1 hypothetical protein TTHERM_00188420 [Tetrahymena thermophila SB210]|eukprot:XP_001016518.1 hypothetical protein TTHERM_00188420 [Tetrahymena thermophila SB210]
MASQLKPTIIEKNLTNPAFLQQAPKIFNPQNITDTPNVQNVANDQSHNFQHSSSKL